MELRAVYPTAEHAWAAEVVTDHYREDPDVRAVILMGSCARGKADRTSCVDILVLLEPEVFDQRRDGLEMAWEEFNAMHPALATLRKLGRFTHVDLDFVDGDFRPVPRGWTDGPDAFELEIGNTLAYTVPLHTRGNYLAELKARWLPYYDEALAVERLAMARKFCLNDLYHIPDYAERGLYFQAFKRLYDASREFLQALFIAKRTYPIAYDKWVREEVAEVLGLPELYARLPGLLEICPFESRLTAEKAAELEALLEQYAPAPDYPQGPSAPRG